MRQTAFRSGERVEVRGGRDTFDAALLCAAECVGGIAYGRQGRSAELTIGSRSWLLGGYARGWRVAAFEADGRVAAAYSDRWLMAGRLWLGATTASVQVPLALRNWTVRVDGEAALELDRAGWALEGRVGRLPLGPDDDLLLGFAIAVVWTRVRFRTRPMKSVHVEEGRAETLDVLLDAGFDVDGDGDVF